MFEDLVSATNDLVQEHLGGAMVTYQVPGQPPRQVRGIFDREHAEAVPGGVTISTAEPQIAFTLKDLAAVGIVPQGGHAGHRITLGVADGGSSWIVQDAQPDGLGMVRLMLHAAAPYEEDDE